MPEIDDFLLSIEDDEDQEQEPKPQIDPKKLGYALRQEQKEKKAMAKKLAELEEFQQQVLAEKRTQALKAAGLNDFHAEVYSKFYEDVTPEAVQEYRVRAGLEAAQAEEEESASREPQLPPRFAPVSGGEALGAAKLTKAEFEKIMRADPQKGWQLLNSGKVDFS